MVILAVSDVVWQALIALVLAVFMGLMKMHTDKQTRDDAREQRAEAAHAARELKEIKTVGQATYAFQNHAMGIVKKALAVSTRTRADATHDVKDIAEAEAAEKEWVDHQAGQAKVDAQVVLLEAAERAKEVIREASLNAKVDKVLEEKES